MDSTGQTNFNVVKCGYCPVLVVWAVTVNGAWMPVEATPTPYHGNVSLHPRDGDPPRATVHGKDHSFGRANLHYSHFVTCPHAKALRRRGQPNGKTT